MLSVYMCARFQAAPKECHLRAAKRIMRYLVLSYHGSERGEPKLPYVCTGCSNHMYDQH
jgi:hypothetical protein